MKIKENTGGIRMKKQEVPRGFIICPACSQIMSESVGDDGNDYYVCLCGNKRRIFHKPVERTCDNRGCA